VPKLCTIRLSRKVFPGFKKYGLGHLTRELGIQIENRHRAGGDALATAQVLDLVLQNNGQRVIKEMLAKENKDYLLPPNLPKAMVSRLPNTPGVYYFHNKAGKVIYVGKAKNIKKRVVSHFTGLDVSKKRQDFLREIYEVVHVDCPTEFIASLLESIEIKRLWPIYNKSQKRYEQLWGIYVFEDNRGYFRLAIDKKHKHVQPVICFPLLVDAHRSLWKMVKDYGLHPALCFLDKNQPSALPEVAPYNTSVKQALAALTAQKETYIIQEKEHTVLVENGQFIGMGAFQSTSKLEILTEDILVKIKSSITPYAENEVLKSMIRKYVERYPHKVLPITQ
jgi:DNA polymerase-3 subunit epsilon